MRRFDIYFILTLLCVPFAMQFPTFFNDTTPSEDLTIPPPSKSNTF